MNTGEFLSLLNGNPNKQLVFFYKDEHAVGANYHITEVKNVTIDSVDCGGRTDSWNETVIQLWESPAEAGKTDFMTADKAMSILSKVDRMKPMDPSAILKFEYGNAEFHTAQLQVTGTSLHGEKLLVKMSVNPTDCKAKELCGVPEPIAVGAEAGGCTPGSGCC